MEDPTQQIHVAIVEDHDIFRKRLSELLYFYKELKLVLIADSAENYFKKLNNLSEAERPQVVLMDIELPGMNGIEATFETKRNYEEMDIIMFTIFEDDARIFDSINVGASGYLLKDTSIDQVVESIKEIKMGGSPISPSIARRVFEMMRNQKENKQPAETPFDLSPAEVKILEQVIEGKTNNEIAESVFLSPWTVKTHIKNIYKKMHVNSRAAAVRMALKRNIV